MSRPPDLLQPRKQGRQNRRVGCLLVPDLPLRAQLRAHPELEGVPFVVASGSDARADVIEVSPAAVQLGVRARGTVTHARAVCGDVRVQVMSPALDRASRRTLLDVALSFSPRAEIASRSAWAFSGEGAVLLDASGMGQLYPSERHFASALAARAEAMGFPGVVSVASSRNVARIAARQCANLLHQNRNQANLCVVPAGSESAFLAPLSIDLLDPIDLLGQQLTRFGVHTVRDLLKLPRRALAKRLGHEVLQLVAMARGETVEPPLPAPADHRLEEALDLDFPADRVEPLLFVLRGMLSRLMERLALRHLASGALDLLLELDGGGRDVRQVRVAAATRDVRVLLRLLSLALETHPPQSAVLAISLATEGSPLHQSQLDLFRPHGPDPNTLDRTLTELEALCGSGRIGAPEVADDHRPDAFGMKPFQPFQPARSRSTSACQPGAAAANLSLVVRALRPPVSAEVRVNRGLPVHVRCAVSSGDVLHAAGPWRTTGRWWSHTERYALDHYDVQVDDGTVLRLCFDWHRRSWRVDGVYD